MSHKLIPNREVMHQEVIEINGEKDTEKGPVTIELALQWSDAFSETIFCYTNIIRNKDGGTHMTCLLYTSPSPRDLSTSRMPSSA